EVTRSQVERGAARTRAERAVSRIMFELFTHPGRLRALEPFLAVAQRLGMTRVARRPALVRRFPRLAALARVSPAARLRPEPPLPEFMPARGARRGRVALLQGCVQRAVFARVNRATASVLTAEGFDVVAPTRPRCCGALMLHTGHEAAAQDSAMDTIAALKDCDMVAVNAA